MNEQVSSKMPPADAIEGVRENILPAARLNSLRNELTILMTENPQNLAGEEFDQAALRLTTEIDSLKKRVETNQSSKKVPGLRRIWKMFTGNKQ